MKEKIIEILKEHYVFWSVTGKMRDKMLAEVASSIAEAIKAKHNKT